MIMSTPSMTAAVVVITWSQYNKWLTLHNRRQYDSYRDYNLIEARIIGEPYNIVKNKMTVPLVLALYGRI